MAMCLSSVTTNASLDFLTNNKEPCIRYRVLIILIIKPSAYGTSRLPAPLLPLVGFLDSMHR